MKRNLAHASFPELSFTKNNRVYVRGHKYVLDPTHTLVALRGSKVPCATSNPVSFFFYLFGIECSYSK